MDKNEKATLANLIRVLAEYKGKAEQASERMHCLRVSDQADSGEYFSQHDSYCSSMIRYWEIALILSKEWGLKIQDRRSEEYEINFLEGCRERNAKKYSDWRENVGPDIEPQWNGGWGEDYAMMRNER